MEKTDVLFQSICAGKKEQVISAVKDKLEENIDPLKILNEIMIPAMREVGERYSRSEIFLPEMVISAKAMHYGIKIRGYALDSTTPNILWLLKKSTWCVVNCLNPMVGRQIASYYVTPTYRVG